jgi:PTH1 family peptidyl-tRNA hydrolase
MKLIIGLGNPGRQYEGTRHNVGFAVADLLAQSPSAGKWQSRFQADVCELLEDGTKLLLVKPQTYMNLSGRCVRSVVDFYQLEAADLLVVCDDISLPLGKLRARARGTHGGHNGLRDVQTHLGTTEYARLRVGVDGPGGRDAADHVLERFKASERDAIEDAVRLAAQAVAVWAFRGIDACMNEFNAEKGKKEKE